jgi:anti-anti-sigma factor
MQQQSLSKLENTNAAGHNQTTPAQDRQKTPQSPFLSNKELSLVRQPLVRDSDSNYPPGLAVQPYTTAAEAVGKHNQERSSLEKQTIIIRSIPLGKETTLTISESRAGTALVAVCSIQGYIDQTNAEDFNVQLMSMLDFGVRFFIIDCEHTNLIGSAGWGILAVAARLIKAAQGHLLICSMSSDIEEGYLLMQFNEIIDSKKTILDCLDAIAQILATRKDILPDNNDINQSFSPYGESFDDIPIQEKLKTIIARHGPLNFFQIAGKLKQQQYGNVKLNPFKLYLILKELNLESSLKRKRFYRSC